jgi:threonine dehydrogenase-like Zn-dependent dehydrogenase
VRALVASPGAGGSARVADLPIVRAGADELLIRALEVGVCGTDREISAGLFGVAPPGRDQLVLGHEFLGLVERDGHGFAKGDLVTATVRRSCGRCAACLAGSPDSCDTGDYLERGITALDGFASEVVVEHPAHVVPVPASLGRLGVLAEPASICARGLRHAEAIGARQPWSPTQTLVLGTGAIGMLASFLLRLRGDEVWTAGQPPPGSDKAQLIDAIGARYVCTASASPPALAADVGGFDLVVEATGDAQVMIETLGLLRRNGVACLLGIDPREGRVALNGQIIGVDVVLQNRAVFGSVNAARVDWTSAIDQLDRARMRWPEALDACVGLRVPLDRFDEAFAFGGVKATLQLGEP